MKGTCTCPSLSSQVAFAFTITYWKKKRLISKTVFRYLNEEFLTVSASLFTDTERLTSVAMSDFTVMYTI